MDKFDSRFLYLYYSVIEQILCFIIFFTFLHLCFSKAKNHAVAKKRDSDKNFGMAAKAPQFFFMFFPILYGINSLFSYIFHYFLSRNVALSKKSENSHSLTTEAPSFSIA